MNTQQIIWLVVLLSCLFLFAIVPVLYAIQAFLSSRRGEKTEIPQSYRYIADSISLGQDTFKRLRQPFAQEEADLAELAELTKSFRDEDQEPN